MGFYGRNSLIAPISEDFALATTDDLNGVADATQTYDITGASRLLITQVDDTAGADGTAGIDVVEYSFDGGYEWEVADDIRTIDAADDSAALAGGALNAAGVEPAAGVAVFKGGPYIGPVQVRVSRGAQGNGTAWVTTAPSIKANVIGLTRDAVAAEA